MMLSVLLEKRYYFARNLSGREGWKEREKEMGVGAS